MSAFAQDSLPSGGAAFSEGPSSDFPAASSTSSHSYPLALARASTHLSLAPVTVAACGAFVVGATSALAAQRLWTILTTKTRIEPGMTLHENHDETELFIGDDHKNQVIDSIVTVLEAVPEVQWEIAETQLDEFAHRLKLALSSTEQSPEPLVAENGKELKIQPKEQEVTSESCSTCKNAMEGGVRKAEGVEEGLLDAPLSLLECLENLRKGGTKEDIVLRMKQNYPSQASIVEEFFKLATADSAAKEETPLAKPPTAHTTAKEETPSNASPSPSAVDSPIDPALLKYTKMLKVGIPKAAVLIKMKSEDVSSELIENFLRLTSDTSAKEDASSNASSSPSTVDSPIDPVLVKYTKMLKVGIPKAAVLIKMKSEDVSSEVIESFLRLTSEPQDAASAPRAASESNTRTGGDSPSLVDAASSQAAPEPAKAELDPALLKYSRMLKVGIPKEAVVLKMKSEGIAESLVDEFNRHFADPSSGGAKATEAKSPSALPPPHAATAASSLPPMTPLKRTTPPGVTPPAVKSAKPKPLIAWNILDSSDASKSALWREEPSKDSDCSVVDPASVSNAVELYFRAQKSASSADAAGERPAANDENLPPTPAGKRGVSTPSVPRSATKKTFYFLTAQRAQNVQIGLVRLKMSPQEVALAVRELRADAFARGPTGSTEESLELVARLLPSDEEMLQATKPHPNLSDPSEIFFQLLAEHARDAKRRVECMRFPVRFATGHASMQRDLHELRHATKVLEQTNLIGEILLACREFGRVLHQRARENGVGSGESASPQIHGLSILGLGDLLQRTMSLDGRFALADLVLTTLKSDDALIDRAVHTISNLNNGYQRFGGEAKIKSELLQMERDFHEHRAMTLAARPDEEQVTSEWERRREKFEKLRDDWKTWNEVERGALMSQVFGLPETASLGSLLKECDKLLKVMQEAAAKRSRRQRQVLAQQQHQQNQLPHQQMSTPKRVGPGNAMLPATPGNAMLQATPGNAAPPATPGNLPPATPTMSEQYY